jgi:hypothetical protein
MVTLMLCAFRRMATPLPLALVIFVFCFLVPGLAKQSKVASDPVTPSELVSRYNSIKEFQNEWTAAHPANLIYKDTDKTPPDMPFYYMDCVASIIWTVSHPVT